MPADRPTLKLVWRRQTPAPPANDAPALGNLRAPAIDLRPLRRVAILGKIS